MDLFNKINMHIADKSTNSEPFVTYEYLKEKSILFKMLYDKNFAVFSDSSEDESEGSDEEEEESGKKNNNNKNRRKNQKRGAKEKKDKEKRDDKGKIDDKEKKDIELSNDSLIRSHRIGGYIPGLNLRLKIPRKSALNSMEHSEYLRLMESVKNKPATSKMLFRERRDLHLFHIMNDVVMKEQQEFLSFVKNQWPRLAFRRTFQSTWVQRYVKEVWEHCLSRAFSYPRSYSSFGGPIPLVYPSNRPEVQLDWVQDLLILGQPKRYQFELSLEKNAVGVKICKDYSEMVVAYPPGDTEHDPNTLYKVPVSKDKNAEYLAGVHNVDVVISSSGLKTIAGNLHNFDKSWDIPVVIKELKYQEDGMEKSKRVVFVDKTLPPKTMTAYERNLWWFKRAVKLMTLEHRGKSTGKTVGISAGPSQPAASNVAEVSSSKTLPNASQSSVASGGDTNKKAPSVVEDDDGSESDNLVIDEETMDDLEQTSGLADLSLSSSSNSSCIPPRDKLPTPSDSTVTHTTAGKSQSKEALTVQLPDDGNSSKMVAPPETNITYRLWRLSPVRRNKEDLREDFLKGVGNSRNINLLVRCKLDAIEGEENTVPVTVVPKLEYQYEFGAESSTPPEIIRQWTTLQFRPFCKIARVRVDPMTSEVLMVQWVTQQTLLSEALQHHIKVRPFVNGTLYSVLSHLVDLPVGYYMLSHSARNTGFVDLLCHNPDGGNYNLHMEYLQVNPAQVTEEVVPWPGIDNTVMTPVNEYLKHIPGTFLPTPYKVNASKLSPWKKNRNKKKKKKRGQVTSPKKETSQTE